jgi:TRAP-type C4-dicarboxylate transport system permease large subunit
MGLITPPVGVNVFIVKSVAPDVPLGEIFLGVAPFLVAMIVTVVILTIFPQTALFLPQQMIG